MIFRSFFFSFSACLKPVELPDGSIIVNIRNQNFYRCHCRMVVRSLDGGLSLPVEQLYFDYTLVDPAVAAGVLEKDGVLYFTNPAHEQHSKSHTYSEEAWGRTTDNHTHTNTCTLWGGVKEEN